MDDKEREISRIKRRITNPEVALFPRQLFVESLSIVHSFEESPGQACIFDRVT